MKKLTEDDLEMLVEELEGYQEDTDMMAKNGELTEKEANAKKKPFKFRLKQSRG